MQILILILLNYIFFRRTLNYYYCVDDWENARCKCKKPNLVKGNIKRHGVNKEVEICKTCGILKRTEPKNLWQKFLWSFGGLVQVKGSEDKNIYTQYTNPMFDHSITLIMHIINCVLIYLAFGSNNVSFLTAILFSIHPAAMQGSSVWLSGKGYSAGLMFCLLAYWLKPLAPILYVIGSWYMSVLVLPLVFIKTPYWFYIILIPLIFLYRKQQLKAAISFKYSMVMKTRNPFHWHNILLVFKTIGHYFTLCILPKRLGVHPEYLQMYGVTDKETKESLSLKDVYFWIGCAIVLTTGYMFFYQWSPVAFGLMWFFIFIMPWSNWMAAVHQPISERYTVIALPGALYALSNLIVNQPIAYTAFIVYFATITNQFLPAYRHILDFAVYNIINFPRSFQGWLWKSDIERNFQLWERSFDSAMQAWVLRPDDFLVNNNIATLLLIQRKYKQAEQFLDCMAKAPMQNKEMEEKRDAKVAAIRAQIDRDMEQMKKMMKEKGIKT